MPFYDLRCRKCKEEFNIKSSMRDKVEKHIPCPACGSSELESVFKSAPYYIKSASASDCPHQHQCSSGCCRMQH